jgi:hypothetical protein
MVPLTASPAIFSIPVPAAPGTSTKKNDKALIDYSNAKDGYVMRAERRAVPVQAQPTRKA